MVPWGLYGGVMNGAIRTLLFGSVVGGVALATVGGTLYFMLLGCSNGGGFGNKNNNTTAAQAKPAEPAPAQPAAGPPVYRLPAPVLNNAPNELAGLSLFVQDPYVGDGQAYQNSPILLSLRGALVRAGYRVPLDARGADAVLSLTGQTGGNFATYRLSVIAQGALVDQVVEDLSNVAPGHTLKCEIGECWDHAIIDLVNALSRSPRLVAFGDNIRHQRFAKAPQPVAVPPPPQPVAQPQVVSTVPRASAGPLVAGAPQPSAWALVIGIERYRDVSSPTGARADAERMAQVLTKTLGVPEDHVVVQLDERASRSDIEKQLRWLRQNVTAGGRIYFYFSGHGAPDPSSGTSFLLPYDGDPRFLSETALPLTNVLASLAQSQAKDVLAMVDSCFSGAGGRSVLPPGARPLVRVKEAKAAPRVALFTASSGAEISGPGAQGGGLFTSTVVQALGGAKADVDGDGQISLGELLEWVRPRVVREAKKENRSQTPSVILGAGVADPAAFIVTSGVSGN